MTGETGMPWHFWGTTSRLAVPTQTVPLPKQLNMCSDPISADPMYRYLPLPSNMLFLPLLRPDKSRYVPPSHLILSELGGNRQTRTFTSREFTKGGLVKGG